MTTTAPPPSQPILSFPPATFAKLSPHPYLLAHLQPSSSSKPSKRTNGRSPTGFRKAHVHQSSLTHAEGSAVVRVGDTTVVCGIRGEILSATDIPNHRFTSNVGTERSNEAKDLDLLVPNIELATGCSPCFLPGQPPSTLAQSLSTRVYSMLHSSHLVDSEQLRIYYTPEPLAKCPRSSHSDSDEDMEEEEEEEEPVAEVKGYWTLYIDIMFISLDGNAFDVAWGAVLAALSDTRLPNAYWDADQEMILCSDEISKSKKVALQGLPVASTYLVFNDKTKAGGIVTYDKEEKDRGYWILADPDTFEEGLCDESVTVIVDCEDGKGETKILGISKDGGAAVGRAEMKELVVLAEERWRDWKGAIGSG